MKPADQIHCPNPILNYSYSLDDTYLLPHCVARKLLMDIKKVKVTCGASGLMPNSMYISISLNNKVLRAMPIVIRQSGSDHYLDGPDGSSIEQYCDISISYEYAHSILDGMNIIRIAAESDSKHKTKLASGTKVFAFTNLDMHLVLHRASIDVLTLIPRKPSYPTVELTLSTIKSLPVEEYHSYFVGNQSESSGDDFEDLNSGDEEILNDNSVSNAKPDLDKAPEAYIRNFSKLLGADLRLKPRFHPEQLKYLQKHLKKSGGRPKSVSPTKTSRISASPECSSPDLLVTGDTDDTLEVSSSQIKKIDLNGDHRDSIIFFYAKDNEQKSFAENLSTSFKNLIILTTDEQVRSALAILAVKMKKRKSRSANQSHYRICLFGPNHLINVTLKVLEKTSVSHIGDIDDFYILYIPTQPCRFCTYFSQRSEYFSDLFCDSFWTSLNFASTLPESAYVEIVVRIKNYLDGFVDPVDIPISEISITAVDGIGSDKDSVSNFPFILDVIVGTGYDQDEMMTVSTQNPSGGSQPFSKSSLSHAESYPTSCSVNSNYPHSDVPELQIECWPTITFTSTNSPQESRSFLTDQSFHSSNSPESCPPSSSNTFKFKKEEKKEKDNKISIKTSSIKNIVISRNIQNGVFKWNQIDDITSRNSSPSLYIMTTKTGKVKHVMSLIKSKEKIFENLLTNNTTFSKVLVSSTKNNRFTVYVDGKEFVNVKFFSILPYLSSTSCVRYLPIGIVRRPSPL